MKTGANSLLAQGKVIVLLAQTNSISVALTDPLKTNLEEREWSHLDSARDNTVVRVASCYL